MDKRNVKHPCPSCGRMLFRRNMKKHYCTEMVIDTPELERLSVYWRGKGRRPEWKLSFPQLLSLVEEAGISPFDIGHKGYHLARYNDTGEYELGNCRFITWKENIQERDSSHCAQNAVIAREANVRKAQQRRK